MSSVSSVVKAFLLLACAFPIVEDAQPYPSKPIRCVVPYPAGGPLDKPGAGGNIGADTVVKTWGARVD